MTTLISKQGRDGDYQIYINPNYKTLVDGEVKKVEVYYKSGTNEVESYFIDYKEGHLYLGGRTEETTLLPANIILQN